MNLPNFTAATYFVYTLLVNSSCSIPDPVIQFLNGYWQMFSTIPSRSNSSTWYVRDEFNSLSNLLEKKDHARKSTVLLNQQFLGSYISPNVTSKIYEKERILASDP